MGTHERETGHHVGLDAGELEVLVAGPRAADAALPFRDHRLHLDGLDLLREPEELLPQPREQLGAAALLRGVAADPGGHDVRVEVGERGHRPRVPQAHGLAAGLGGQHHYYEGGGTA